jgi:ABC-2 type transport system permease protein
MIGFLPAYILSGFLFEISSMPVWIQYLTYCIPAKYFVQSLQTLFLVGNIWPLLWKNIAFMLLVGFLLLLLISRKVAKRLN